MKFTSGLMTLRIEFFKENLSIYVENLQKFIEVLNFYWLRKFREQIAHVYRLIVLDMRIRKIK